MRASQCVCCGELSYAPTERMGSILLRKKICAGSIISSTGRRAPSIARLHNIPIPVGRAVLWCADAAKFSCQDGVAIHPALREYLGRRGFQFFLFGRGRVVKPGVRSGAPLSRRAQLAAHNACVIEDRPPPARHARARRSTSLLRSNPALSAPASASEPRWPRLRGPCRYVQRPILASVEIRPSNVRRRELPRSDSDPRAECFLPASFPAQVHPKLAARSRKLSSVRHAVRHANGVRQRSVENDCRLGGLRSAE